MSTQTLCPLCAEGQITQHCEDAQQTYAGHTGAVPMYFRSCTHCGSEFAGAEESLLNRRAMMAFRKRVDGLLPAARVAEIRAKYHLNQSQAARLLGGGPVAFSKYENDDVAQSSAMDALLRLIEKNESAFWDLVEIKGMRAEFVRTVAQPLQKTEGQHYRMASSSAEQTSGAAIYNPKEFRRIAVADTKVVAS